MLLIIILFFILQQEALEQDLDEKRLFIQTHPFFSKWNIPQQRQLQWSLVRSEHRIGDHVIKQGDNVNGLTFLVRYVYKDNNFSINHSIIIITHFNIPGQSEEVQSTILRVLNESGFNT
jgi:hypothetical protein